MTFKYLVKRILISLIIMLGVSILIFALLRVLPGNPIAFAMGDHVNSNTVERLSDELGLNKPIMIQFFDYIKGFITGDMGTSIVKNRPVSSLITSALPNTLILSLLAALFCWVIGIGAAIISTIKKNSIIERIFDGFSMISISTPIFVIAMLLQYFLAFKFGLFSITSSKGDVASFILPAIALSFINVGDTYILAKSLLSDELREDYILTVRAKGATKNYAIGRHALKKSLPPIISLMAMQLASFLSGALITENIFSFNGIGNLSITAILSRDLPLIQGTALYAAALIIIFNLISDIVQSVIDKRSGEDRL